MTPARIRWEGILARAARHAVPIAAMAFTGFLLGAVHGSTAEVQSIQAPLVRVLIDATREPFAIRSAVRVSVQDDRSRTSLTELPAGTHLIQRFGAKFQVGSVLLATDRLRFTAAAGKPLGVRAKSFPGSIAVYANPDGRMSIVNLVDLESYVAGVVGPEIGYSAPAEAQKAQAVAARTYAVSRAKEMRAQSPNGVFDLYADTRSQVYAGACTHEKVWQAVWATRGTVMTDRGNVFVAYYHATCGGVTESAVTLFPAHKCPPLAGGVRCDGCKGAARRVWTTTIPEWRLRSRLSEAGYAVGPLVSISPVDRTPHGRNAHLLLVHAGAKGGSLQIAAQNFRAVAGDDIRSTRFRVVRGKDGFRFEGEGWGHGVGLCQEGALGLARAGRTWTQILDTYYPGHARVQAYGE